MRMFLAVFCFFQCDCQVHLHPTVNPPNLEEYLKAVQLAQLPSQLNKYRVYLTVARSLDYSISEQLTKVSSVLKMINIFLNLHACCPKWKLQTTGGIISNSDLDNIKENKKNAYVILID